MKLKLNPDQTILRKLSNLNPYDRKYYISRLSAQAIDNLLNYVEHSIKWIYTIDADEHETCTNSHLKATIVLDHDDTVHFVCKR
jgi:hypothetical protein